jgi:hypothetical protein
MENQMFLHVGPPVVRLLPVHLVLTPNRSPMVFRPAMNDQQRKKLLLQLQSLIGQKYSFIRVYSFIFRLAAEKYLGFAQPYPNSGADTPELYICTDAVLKRLLNTSSEFQLAVKEVRDLDFQKYRSWSTNDILRLHSQKQNVLPSVNLPPIDKPAVLSNTIIIGPKRPKPVLSKYQKLKTAFNLASVLARSKIEEAYEDKYKEYFKLAWKHSKMSFQVSLLLLLMLWKVRRSIIFRFLKFRSFLLFIITIHLVRTGYRISLSQSSQINSMTSAPKSSVNIAKNSIVDRSKQRIHILQNKWKSFKQAVQGSNYINAQTQAISKL